MQKTPDLTVPDAPTDEALKPGWKTSEFAAVVVTVVTNLIAILVVMGLVPVNDQSGLTQALSAIIGGAVAIISNGAIVWKYVQSRTQVKTAVAHLRANLALEKYHASIEKQEGGGGCQE
jgi:hypothetical protein